MLILFTFPNDYYGLEARRDMMESGGQHSTENLWDVLNEIVLELAV
jgi:hypothetical protein